MILNKSYKKILSHQAWSNQWVLCHGAQGSHYTLKSACNPGILDGLIEAKDEHS